MKITEIIQSKSLSAIQEGKAQDVVAQDIVSHNDGLALDLASYIDEGVAQILRRVKGKGIKPGFRCTSGPRKGRIVAKPSTCFAQRNVEKGAKIRKKRQAKARIAGKKLAVTKRSGGGSRRLKKAQINRGGTRSDRPQTRSPLAGKKLKSKIVKPKK
jgi:hypothetical protein